MPVKNGRKSQRNDEEIRRKFDSGGGLWRGVQTPRLAANLLFGTACRATICSNRMEASRGGGSNCCFVHIYFQIKIAHPKIECIDRFFHFVVVFFGSLRRFFWFILRTTLYAFVSANVSSEKSMADTRLDWILNGSCDPIGQLEAKERIESFLTIEFGIVLLPKFVQMTKQVGVSFSSIFRRQSRERANDDELEESG